MDTINYDTINHTIRINEENEITSKNRKFFSSENNMLSLTYTEKMAKLYQLGCYWGNINHEYALKLLKNKENGSFLLRDSNHESYLFTITFKINDYVYHIRLEHAGNGNFTLQNLADSIESKELVCLIDELVYKSKNGYSFLINTKNNS